MTVHQLSRTEARRTAVRAQLLDAARPPDLLSMVRQLTVIQNDATASIAPSADLVAWSRLGSTYAPEELVAALAGKALIELQGMIRPGEDLALYRAEMAAWWIQSTGWQRQRVEWVKANDAFRRDLLAQLEADGPLTSKELPDSCVKPWRSSGWNNNRNVAQMLESLAIGGEVATIGRNGRDRLWDLASRVYPDDPVVPIEEAIRTRNELRLRSLGIARARGPECPVEPTDVGAVGEPAVIDGVRGSWRVDPDQLDRPFEGRAALLSPLDRLVYDRKRTAEIFEFDFALEMFKPAAKRRWGFYALPILYGDELVGKVDATADRKAGVLRLTAIHQDTEFTPEMTDAVDRELTDLADWLELDLVTP